MGYATASCWWWPVLIDVMTYPLHIRQGASISLSPVVATLDIENGSCRCTGVAGKSGLTKVVELKDTIGRDLVGKNGRKVHLQVFVSCNEATAIAPTTSTSGKGDHVATLQFERLDVVEQRCLRQCLHETAITTCSVGGTVGTLEVILRVASKRRQTAGVREHDGSLVVHTDLAVRAVGCCGTINPDILKPVADNCRGLDVLEDDDRMFSRTGWNVNVATTAKRRSWRDNKIHISSDRYRIRNLRSTSRRCVCRHHPEADTQCQKKCF